MNEFMAEEDARLRGSRVKYRLQFRNRTGMIMCQNFRVTLDERLFYTDLKGDFNVIPLQPGDYFDVKVMG